MTTAITASFSATAATSPETIVSSVAPSAALTVASPETVESSETPAWALPVRIAASEVEETFEEVRSS
eukprot:11752601-Heterocapsa_arctica.AAC.1